MSQLDPRLNAFRDDLAAISLRDRVRASRYAEPEIRQVSAPAAPVRTSPRFDAPLATEALSGELATVYDFREGWAWVQLREDGYVGYMPVDCLSGMIEDNTHRVSARLTYLYPAADMKRPPVTKLSFSCTVAPIGRPEGRFVELSRGGFIFADHLVGIREKAKDFVRVAERFVGVPYLWGGKTSLGIDCSGLVQIALQTSGIHCLRDSDMQMATAGEPRDATKIEAIQRGDLLFWQGHVAIAQSLDWMIHASGHHMEVVVEPIRRAIDRIAETHGPVIAILRPMIDRPAAAQVAADGKQSAAQDISAAQANPARREDQGAGAASDKQGGTSSVAPASGPGPDEKQVAAAAAAVQAAADAKQQSEQYRSQPAPRPAEKTAEPQTKR